MFNSSGHKQSSWIWKGNVTESTNANFKPLRYINDYFYWIFSMLFNLVGVTYSYIEYIGSKYFYFFLGQIKAVLMDIWTFKEIDVKNCFWSDAEFLIMLWRHVKYCKKHRLFMDLRHDLVSVWLMIFTCFIAWLIYEFSRFVLLL